MCCKSYDFVVHVLYVDIERCRSLKKNKCLANLWPNEETIELLGPWFVTLLEREVLSWLQSATLTAPNNA
jgi:hypothetical protein